MTTLYESARKLKGHKDDDIIRHLNELSDGIFSPILQDELFKTIPDKRCMCVYVVYAYSIDTDYCLKSVADERNKKLAADAADMPDYLRGFTFNIPTSLMVAITDYLDMQGDRDFSHLKHQMMIYDKLKTNSILESSDGAGKIDYKFIMETSKYLDILREDIIKLEKTLHSRYGLKVEHDEKANNSSGKKKIAKSGIGPESSAMLQQKQASTI